MPELTAIHIVLLVVTTVIGAILGFIIRGQRAAQEKVAISTSWQEQIDAQRKEHDRLTDQNKALMEQVSQFQASNTDAKNRAKELSIAVQEAFERRDELQREIKDIRGNLEVAVSERNQLQSSMASIDSQDSLLQEKDARIEKLQKDLESWQNRLPPLIERFRERNEDADRLEAELEDARERIRELEGTQFEIEAARTRIEPVTDPEELTDGLDASNDPAEDYVEEAESDSDELIDADDILEEADLDDDDEEEDRDDDSDDGDAEEEDRDDDSDDDENLIADTDDTSVAEAIAEKEADIDTQLEQSLSDTPDDLKQIKGVGPAIEKTLNEMGIFRFQQIAEMSEYDIDRVAQRLKGFRSRIYREDWIGQARDLRDQALHA